MTEWAVTSSVLILVVLILRRCLKGRISLRLQYGLWALVLVRLLLPVSLGHTPVSVLNAVTPITSTQTVEQEVQHLPGNVTTTFPPVDAPVSQEANTPQSMNETPDAPLSPVPVLHGVWLVGAVAVALFLTGVNARFARILRRSRRALPVEGCSIPVYVSQAIPAPCLFGLVRPCIYVTPLAASDETLLRHTLAHELTHFHHRDHLWSVLRGLCLALHWYNPLAWVAAVVSTRDGELSCDEATVARLGESERAAYGRTLLAVTCQGRSNLLLTATSMTGRGRDIKERILLLAKRPKTAALTLAAVVLLAAVAVGCTFTGAKPAEPTQSPAPSPSPAPSQQVQELTQEEIERYQEAFDPIQTLADGSTTSSYISCFFTSYYERPQDLNLEQFLRYFPDDGVVEEGDITQPENNEELQALMAHPLWPFGPDPAFVNVPIHRYTRETVDQVLEQYAGITSADLTGVGADQLIYLEEYDAWYNFTSDFAAGTFPIAYGIREGNMVYLYTKEHAQGCQLILEESEGGFRILAHTLVDESSS